MALWKENQDLRRTLDARKKIERAKGILMTQKGISEPEAFTRLQRQSMKSRIPMEEIAEAIILAEEVHGKGLSCSHPKQASLLRTKIVQGKGEIVERL
jgi:hypothetical protein